MLPESKNCFLLSREPHPESSALLCAPALSPELESLMDGPAYLSADLLFVFPDFILTSTLFSVGTIWQNWASSTRTQDPSFGKHGAAWGS